MTGENKFASPEEADDGRLSDKEWKRNSLPLRFAAYGLMFVSCGFALLVLAFGIRMLWIRPVTYSPLNTVTLIAELLGVGLSLTGMALCMGMDKDAARRGRYLIPAAFGCFFVPVLIRFPLAYWAWRDPIIFSWSVLWNAFLWQLMRALKTPQARIGLRLAFLFSLTAIFWSIMLALRVPMFCNYQDAFAYLGYYPTCADRFLFVVGHIPCIFGMLILWAGAMKQLRMMRGEIL